MIGEFEMITIKVNRDSVCMGDDIESHCKLMEFNDDISLARFLQELKVYVPMMVDCVWVVRSNIGVCGYIIISAVSECSIELGFENMPIKKLGIQEVECKHYYESSFNTYDVKIGAIVTRYQECQTLLEKVKKISAK